MTEEIEQASAAGDTREMDRRVEAVLMSVDRAIAPGRIAQATGLDGAGPVHESVERLNVVYGETGRSFRVESVAGGYQILTVPELHDTVAALHKSREDNKLSPAGLETLAIIAYKQPIMRTDIETVRGVSSGEMIRALMDRHLVKIVGRAEELGRPMLYGTTKYFLEVFGLASLKDLPSSSDLLKP